MQVDGVNATRTAFCVQENVILTCTLASIVHVWTVPGYIDDAAVLGSTTTPTDAPFMLAREDVINSNVISSLSFTVFPELDGVTITCSDGAVDPETQTLTATVPGKAMVTSCVCM